MRLFEYLNECYGSGCDAVLLLWKASETSPILVQGKVQGLEAEAGFVQVNGQAIQQADVIGFPEPSF